MVFSAKRFESASFEFIVENSDYIYSQLLEHKIIIFSNMDISFEQHKELMCRVHPKPNHLRTLQNIDHQDLFESFNKSNLLIPDKNSYFMHWHIDDSWLAEIVDVESIYMHTLAFNSLGGQTRWVNLESVRKALDQELIDFIRPLKIRPWNGDSERDSQRRMESPPHGTIRVHPDTQAESIFYPGIVSAEECLDEARWKRYIENLLKFFELDEFTFKLNWNKNDLVIWDNRCTAHAVMGGFDLGSRIFDKIEVGKSAPLFASCGTMCHD